MLKSKIRLYKLLVILVVVVFIGCKTTTNKKFASLPETSLVYWNNKLTDVIVSDIFTPPVASRIYAYPNVAAYEVMRNADTTYNSYLGKLNELNTVPKPVKNEKYNYPLASIIAFNTVAKTLVYNGDSIAKLQENYLYKVKETEIDSKTIQNSIEYGESVGSHIVKWAEKDGYKQRTALSRYHLKNNPGLWKPTPPDYMEAIEPNWNTLRPFAIDSAKQFKPAPPTKFDTIPSSQFYKETLYVYETVKNLTEENFAKAKFWDCNPNISYTQGHVMYYKQQISPGGHWMMIGCEVINKEKLNFLKASETLSLLGITIADAFISCWTEKYNSNLIRPETYINKYIDAKWKPVLQTPAFPEYTSGHSVASGAAAVVLTNLFGKNYSFIDSTEVKYGLPTRSFTSFKEASDEAAISRLYGGIHYMPAITNGVTQGRQIGDFVMQKITLK